jgi:hypothetical protein
MNWTCVVYGGPMFIAFLWFLVDARKWFKGPRVNVEHRMLGDAENVLEAKGSNTPDTQTEDPNVNFKDEGKLV